MTDKKSEKNIKSDYSLLLDNLRKALYTTDENPYTEAGSVFYFCSEDNSIRDDYRDRFLKKRTNSEAAFGSVVEHVDIRGLFRTSPGTNNNEVQISQLLFWMAHLAGWKRLGASPKNDQIYRLFTDSSGATKKYRSEFKRDLENTKFVRKEDGHIALVPVGSSVWGSHSPGIVASEYIVALNYQIVKDFTGGRKALLRKVICDFAKNMQDAERVRCDQGESSLIPKNEKEVEELCSHLNRMILAYDKLPDSEVDQKDWLLSRCLSWLVIGAMLRDCLSTELINSSLVSFLPLPDGTIFAVPHSHIPNADEFLFNNFQPNEDAVFGRDGQIRRISELFDAQGKGTGRSRIVYIQGIGGIGKSTLAKAFAERNQENYDVIMEVSAPSAKEAVMLLSASVPEVIQYPARLQRIIAYCRKRKMLLIVHDYNQPEDESYGDWGKLGCDILLTGWFDRRVLGVRTVRLETNDGSDADILSASVEIFQSNYIKNAVLSDDSRLQEELEQLLDEQKDSVRELCAMTGCHPLTIKVMAMQASCTPGLENKPKDMVQEYHEHKIEHTDARRFGIAKDGYAHRFGDALTHLQDVFERAVKNNSFSKEEFSCLRNMTLVPYAWGISAGRYAEWTGEDAEWLPLLTRKGWLEYDRHKVDVLSENKDVGIYKMPMAIADVLCRVDETSPDIRSCSKYISILSGIDIISEKTYHRREAYASGAETAALRLQEETSVEYAAVINECAYILHHVGTNINRRHFHHKILIKALEIRHRVLGEDHPDTATSYNNVGYSYRDLGELQKGLEYQEKALEINRRVLGEDHPDTATSYNNVGISYYNLGERQKGLEYQVKALEISRRVLGEDHPYTAQSYSNVGISYCDLGERQKGLEYQEKALEIRHRVLGEGHPDTAQSYSNVGVSYWDFGERQKGLEYQEKALEINRRVLGEDHPDTATSYNNVGYSYEDLGELQKGLEYQEKALEIRCRVLGEDHPDTAASYNNVGMSYEELGERQKGLEYKEKALEIRRRVLGEDHPNTAASYNNVGYSYRNLGERQKGLEYQEKALEIRRRVLGEDHPDTAQSYNDVGISYEDLGARQKGLEYKEKALEIRCRVLSEDHTDTAASYNNVGYSYEKLGERQKGLEYKEKALEIRRRVLGEDHPYTAQSYSNVGYSYRNLGERQKGLEYQEKALEIRRRVLGEDHPDTAQSYNDVGKSYWDFGERQKGLEYQVKALEIRRHVLGEDYLDMVASYTIVGLTYATMRDYQTALSLVSEARRILSKALGVDEPKTIEAKNLTEEYNKNRTVSCFSLRRTNTLL